MKEESVLDVAKRIVDAMGQVDVVIDIKISSVYGSTNLNQTVEKEIKEDTLCSVILLNAGATRLPVVKLVKQHLDIGLKEAKDMVDIAPYTGSNTLSPGRPVSLAWGQSKEFAEKFKKDLTDAGAVVEIIPI